MKIFLVGFMGSGKTTAGRKLSANLKYRFVDLDDYIEKKEGCSVNRIFSEKGEDYFRKMESVWLHEIASMDEDLVISTGGGTPCFFDNMVLMNCTGKTIYLKADAKSIAGRLKKSGEKRPLIAGKNHDELIEFITKTLKERESFYLKAQYTIPALGLTVLKIKELIGL